MTKNLEQKPLHEIILDILFYENTEIPAFLSPDEISWKIRDPEISERQVREVLDWLVHNKKATVRTGKYQIDRYEFIDRANKEKQQEKPLSKQQKTSKPSLQIKRVIVEKAPLSTPKKRKFQVVEFIYLLLCCLCVGGLYYWYVATEDKASPLLVTHIPEVSLKKLYLATSDEVTHENKNLQAAYSFRLQNAMNDNLKNAIDSLAENNKNLEMQLSVIYSQWKEERRKTNNKLLAMLLLNIVVLIGVFYNRFKK